MEPKKSRNTFRKSWKRKFTMINTVVKSFHPSTLVKKSHYSMETSGCQPQWSVSTTHPDHTLFKHQKVKSIGETTDNRTNAEHRKTYLEHQRKINPRHHQTPRCLKSGQYLVLLQKHHLHKCRNLQCVLIPDDWSRSLLTLRTMNTSLLLLQTC